jgi:hypothetical protein
MGPHLEPGQRLAVSWVVHHLRAQLHLVDGHAEMLALQPLAAADRAHVDAIRAVIRQLVAGLDELLAEPRVPERRACPP